MVRTALSSLFVVVVVVAAVAKTSATGGAFIAVSRRRRALQREVVPSTQPSCGAFGRPCGNNGAASLSNLGSYSKYHEYAWSKLDGEEEESVPSDLRSNSSPLKGGAKKKEGAEGGDDGGGKDDDSGPRVVATLRSTGEHESADRAIRLARSAWLETRIGGGEEETASSDPMSAIHVLNLVLFPDPDLREDGEYLGLPVFGADVVSLPGGRHLIAIDFQPVLPPPSDDDAAEVRTVLPGRYRHFEERLASIHAGYQKPTDDGEGASAILPWGGDIPAQATRYFSPYALWTRLSGEDAMEKVDTVVYEAFQKYFDLYLELMGEVQTDLDAGELTVERTTDMDDENHNNLARDGQISYLDYRRTNDPARPMLQRLYGKEWTERVIHGVLFPDL